MVAAFELDVGVKDIPGVAELGQVLGQGDLDVAVGWSIARDAVGGAAWQSKALVGLEIAGVYRTLFEDGGLLGGQGEGVGIEGDQAARLLELDVLPVNVAFFAKASDRLDQADAKVTRDGGVAGERKALAQEQLDFVFVSEAGGVYRGSFEVGAGSDEHFGGPANGGGDVRNAELERFGAFEKIDVGGVKVAKTADGLDPVVELELEVAVYVAVALDGEGLAGFDEDFLGGGKGGGIGGGLFEEGVAQDFEDEFFADGLGLGADGEVNDAIAQNFAIPPNASQTQPAGPNGIKAFIEPDGPATFGGVETDGKGVAIFGDEGDAGDLLGIVGAAEGDGGF